MADDAYNSSYDDFWQQYVQGNSDILDMIQRQIQSAHIHADKITVGAGTNFDINYDPSTKETPTGAQDKSDAALQAAKDYRDQWAKAGTTEIDGANIYTGSITASKIAVTSLDAISANLGTVTAGSLTSNTTINVKTNLTVGNNIYLGTFTDRQTSKTIYFNDIVSISAQVDALSLGSGTGSVNITGYLNSNNYATIRNWIYSKNGNAGYFAFDSSNYLKIYNAGAGSMGAQFWINGSVKATWTSLTKVRLDPTNADSFAVNHAGSMQPRLDDIIVVDGDSTVYLDERFSNFVGDYYVFVNNGQVIDKQEDHFTVKGKGEIVCMIIGIEKGKEDVRGYDIVTDQHIDAKTNKGKEKGDFIEANKKARVVKLVS